MFPFLKIFYDFNIYEFYRQKTKEGCTWITFPQKGTTIHVKS